MHSWGLIVGGVDKLKCTDQKLSSTSSFKKQELPEKLVLSKGPQQSSQRSVFYKDCIIREIKSYKKSERDQTTEWDEIQLWV